MYGPRLVLTFESGSKLTVLDTSEQYESFWIGTQQAHYRLSVVAGRLRQHDFEHGVFHR